MVVTDYEVPVAEGGDTHLAGGDDADAAVGRLAQLEEPVEDDHPGPVLGVREGDEGVEGIFGFFLWAW